MAVYIYTRSTGCSADGEQLSMRSYALRQGLHIDEVIHDNEDIKLHWGDRRIGHVLKYAKPGDTVLVHEAPHLACSTSQILELLNMSAKRRVNIYFFKYNTWLDNRLDSVNSSLLLTLIGKVESDFISKRTAKALARRKAAGFPLGRPKGRGNKQLKLDKYKADIIEYLSLGLSKASIAKLVDCHPQTLYDWLERNHSLPVD